MIALITSVDYSDFLAVTLPAWQRVWPAATFRVLTSRRDRQTRAVAAHAGAEVFLTEVWQQRGAKFNRAAALDLALRSMPRGTAVASIDADVFPCGAFPSDADIEPNVLYGCARYLCATPAELAAHHRGDLPHEALPLLDTRLDGPGYLVVPDTDAAVERTASACLGYFQAFRYVRHRFGSYPTAGQYDTAFAAQFATRRAIPLGYVLHLGPSAGRNWSGRVVPRWRAA